MSKVLLTGILLLTPIFLHAQTLDPGTVSAQLLEALKDPGAPQQAQSIAPPSTSQPSTAAMPSPSSDTQTKIVALLEQVKQLQAILSGLLAARASTPSSTQFSAPTSTVSAIPPALTRDLSFGSRGDDVALLQRFLTETGDYTYGEITGYFGSVTETAVKRYQSRLGIVLSGSPATTGYGTVGPRTRASIVASLAATPPDDTASGAGAAAVPSGGGQATQTSPTGPTFYTPSPIVPPNPNTQLCTIDLGLLDTCVLQ